MKVKVKKCGKTEIKPNCCYIQINIDHVLWDLMVVLKTEKFDKHGSYCNIAKFFKVEPAYSTELNTQTF